jgi:hypothetical protein
MEKTLKVTIAPVTREALKSKDDAEMLQIIAEGKGKMRGYAKNLSPEEQLLGYVSHPRLKSWACACVKPGWLDPTP